VVFVCSCGFLGAVAWLGWSERSFLRSQALLLQLEDAVVQAGCEPDMGNQGKLVHVSCPVTETYNFLQDPELNLTLQFVDAHAVKAAWISVTARIFQVVESFHKDELVFEASKADDKGVYHFHRQWSEERNREQFHCFSLRQRECRFPPGGPSAVQNYGNIPKCLNLGKVYAPEGSVKVGSINQEPYILNSGLIQQFGSPKAMQLNVDEGEPPVEVWMARQKYGFHRSGTATLKFRRNGRHRTGIGDLTVVFEQAEMPSQVSIIAKQGPGGRLVPGEVSGETGSLAVNWMREGQVDFQEFLAEMLSTRQLWAKRSAGFFLAWLSLYFLMLRLLLDQNFTSVRLLLGSCLIAWATCLFVTSACWLFRPWFSIITLLAACFFLACAWAVFQLDNPAPDQKPLESAESYGTCDA